jgi:hypothetical protein
VLLHIHGKSSSLFVKEDISPLNPSLVVEYPYRRFEQPHKRTAVSVLEAAAERFTSQRA